MTKKKPCAWASRVINSLPKQATTLIENRHCLSDNGSLCRLSERVSLFSVSLLLVVKRRVTTHS
ncbi:unnamed protein product [Arabidopsis halleri]